MKVEIITTPTFIKLIVISSVPSKSFGRSNNFKTSLYLISEPVLSSLKSLGVKEKKAISEPEIKAEINNNTIIVEKKRDNNKFPDEYEMAEGKNKCRNKYKRIGKTQKCKYVGSITNKTAKLTIPPLNINENKEIEWH